MQAIGHFRLGIFANCGLAFGCRPAPVVIGAKSFTTLPPSVYWSDRGHIIDEGRGTPECLMDEQNGEKAHVSVYTLASLVEQRELFRQLTESPQVSSRRRILSSAPKFIKATNVKETESEKSQQDFKDVKEKVAPEKEFSIDRSNLGRRLLEKQGWRAEEGLVGVGKNGEGITEPVKTRLKNDKRGIGAGSNPLRITHPIIEVKKVASGLLVGEKRRRVQQKVLSKRERKARDAARKLKERKARELIFTDFENYGL